MKIVLSTPPGRTTERWPPLGLLYIASMMRVQRPDDEVRVVDAFCENLRAEDLVHRIERERPDIFGMNCSTHTFLSAIRALENAHRVLPETTIVMGGFHATFTAEQILHDYPFVDYIIKGEAEHAFPMLVECIEGGRTPADVDGISFMKDGGYVSRPPATEKDLDALPFPARDLVEGLTYGYSHRGVRLAFGKFTTVCSSRGCPFRCTYCSCAAFSHRRWRPRSAANVVEELDLLYDQGYETAVFVDDNFTLKKSRVEEICEQIRERKIRMRFYCEGRVDNAPYPLLRTMKKAGFDVIYFGVESASKHVLDYYKKGITSAQSRTAIADAKRARMLVVTSYIFGAPVETQADILRTIDFIRTSRPHAIQVNILDCLIGTPIWDDMVRAGVVAPEDWKRNHRIYEYHEDGLSRELLDDLTSRAHAAHADGWKNRDGLRDFLRLLWSNQTGRRVILGNLLRFSTMRRMSKGAQSEFVEPASQSESTPLSLALADGPRGGTS